MPQLRDVATLLLTVEFSVRQQMNLLDTHTHAHTYSTVPTCVH